MFGRKTDKILEGLQKPTYEVKTAPVPEEPVQVGLVDCVKCKMTTDKRRPCVWKGEGGFMCDNCYLGVEHMLIKDIAQPSGVDGVYEILHTLCCKEYKNHEDVINHKKESMEAGDYLEGLKMTAVKEIRRKVIGEVREELGKRQVRETNGDAVMLVMFWSDILKILQDIECQTS